MAKLTAEKKLQVYRLLRSAEYIPYITNEDSANVANARISALYEALTLILEVL